MSERDAIRQRLAAQRQARQQSRRTRQRRMHAFIGAALLIGLLSVVPRYPGILALLLPPVAVGVAALIGYGLLRVPALDAGVRRVTGQAPGFWAWLITGGLVLAAVFVLVAASGGLGGVPVREW